MRVFIERGDKPMSLRQATNRGYLIMLQELGKAGARPGDEKAFAGTAHDDLPERLISILYALPGQPETYSQYAADWEQANTENSANNMFNHQLKAYADASERLARYKLSEGVEERTELVESGEYDEHDQPIMESVLLARAIEPLPHQVEQAIHDEDTGEPLGVQLIDNPLIVLDEAERQKAEYILSAMPQEVAEFYTVAQGESDAASDG